MDFMRHPYGPMLMAEDTNKMPTGILVFRRAQDDFIDEKTEALEVFVSGDTAAGIYIHVTGKTGDRPTGLDLMYQIVQRGQAISKRDWTILRVAIVELKNEIYIGRMFFGDKHTQQVMWDCDCRPSDATWVSLKANCPFFVHKTVWKAASTPLQETHVYRLINHARKSTVPMTQRGLMDIQPDDFEEIKLLKRELDVAVREEDYATAIKIRDHPYMQLYNRYSLMHAEGQVKEASVAREQLASMIQLNREARPGPPHQEGQPLDKNA